MVAYDGTDYGGFQRQANAPTVQAALERALDQVAQAEIGILAAGRTDAGVHAAGQVVAFDVGWRHGLDDLWRALNAVLPADVAVQSLQEAAPDFHPRYAARSRRYRYSIYNAAVRWPQARRYSLHVISPLDVGAMQEAAQALVGERDFATFGQPPQGENTVRRVIGAGWGGEPPWLTFDIEGNAFLYRMVRSIVGTLLQVGRGAMSLEAFQQALAAC